MLRPLACSLLMSLFGGALLLGQDEAKLSSGPPAGAVLPGPFASLQAKGEDKGSYKCLVCRFGLNPTVLVFAREGSKESQEGLTALLQKLDETVEQLPEKSMKAAVIYLSPAAHSSLTKPDESDPEKIAQQAAAREALVARLAAESDKLKHIAVATYPPEGPKGYQLNPKADVTVLFYRKMKIKENFAFAPGALREADVEAIARKVRDELAPPKEKGKK